MRRAIEEAQATKGFIAETLPKAMQGVPDPKLLDELRSASGDASRALDDFAGWLTRDLLPRARGDFALGRDRLMETLRRGEGVDVTPELLVSLGERELKDARRRLDEATRAATGKSGAEVSRAARGGSRQARGALDLGAAAAGERGRVRAHAAPVDARPSRSGPR